jgi:membrane protein DedA with SNARE-associated domain
MAPELAIPYLAELSYLAIPIVLFLGSSGFFPIPEEIILLIVGYASFTGVLNLWLAIFVAIVSVVLSDVIHFYCATHGHGLLKRLLHGKTIIRVKRAMNRHAFWTVFIARFVPVMRILTPWVAGSSGMKFKKFLVANILGTVVQTPIMIWIGYKLGAHAQKGITFIEHYDALFAWAGLLIVAVGFALLYKRVKRLRTKRGGNHG